MMDYKVTYIQIGKLSVVWAKAQRPYQEKWSKEIADNFDPDKFEPIIVTKPNGAGIYHIVEGQHRKGAVEMLWGDKEQVPCRVVDHADPARAAEIWLGINKGRKAVRPVVSFLVAVEARRDIEVAINNIVRKAGYHVGENTKADNCISAVGALRKVYAYGGQTLLHTLQASRLIWGSDPRGVSGAMLVGFGRFLNEFHDHVDPNKLRTVLHDKYRSPWKLEDAAATFREKISEPIDVAMSDLIRRQYNQAIRDPAKRLKRKELE